MHHRKDKPDTYIYRELRLGTTWYTFDPEPRREIGEDQEGGKTTPLTAHHKRPPTRPIPIRPSPSPLSPC
jgi:hypothetical protein